jgi:ribosomal protein L7Ae-like RNA K-turn-binding protein
VKYDVVLRRIEEELNNLHTRRQGKIRWTEHILNRTCILILIIHSVDARNKFVFNFITHRDISFVTIKCCNMLGNACYVLH